MDLIGWDRAAYARIEDEYRRFAEELDFARVDAVPLSALHGDNLLQPSAHTPWYSGLPLLHLLETLQISEEAGSALRLPVQWVNRPEPGLPRLCRTNRGRSVRPGDRVRVVPSGASSTVARIVTLDGDLPEAELGQSVTLTLSDEIDISRAMSSPPSIPRRARRSVSGRAVLDERSAAAPRSRLRSQAAPPPRRGDGHRIKHRIDVNSGLTCRPRRCTKTSSRWSTSASIARWRLSRTARIVAWGLILVDRLSADTSQRASLTSLRRAANIHWQAVDIDRGAREAQKLATSALRGFTGLSGSANRRSPTSSKTTARRGHAYLSSRWR